MTNIEATVLWRAYEIYTTSGAGTEFTAMHMERCRTHGAKQIRVSTSEALFVLRDQGWLKGRQIESGEEALGYTGHGRRPMVFQLVGKKARSAPKAFQKVLG